MPKRYLPISSHYSGHSHQFPTRRHVVANCPLKGPGSAVTKRVLVSKTEEASQRSRPLFHTKILLSEGPQTLATFIDSGANGSFMDINLATQMGLSQEPLPRPVPAKALYGHLLGTVPHQTSPVTLLVSGSHQETISFHLLHSLHIPVILGCHRLALWDIPEMESVLLFCLSASCWPTQVDSC